MKTRLAQSLLATAVACLAPIACLAGSVDDTRALFDRHNAAFAAGDIEALLADYSEDAVFIGPMGVLRGHSEIRDFFGAVIAEFAKPGASFTVNQTAFTDNVAYFAWQAETADNVYEVGGDTFVIEEGKIVTQTLTLKAVQKQ